MTTGVTTAGTLADRLVPARGSLANPLVRDGLLVLAGTILMALLAQISIPLAPFSPVPITGQTLGVYLIGAIYGPRLGAITLAAYLGQGLLGLPVFAMGLNAWSPSMIPGLPVIIGPTAGYLLAFPLAAFVVGLLANRGWDRNVRTAIPAMLIGELIILVCGFAWLVTATFMLTGSVSLTALFLVAVLPFLPGTAIKIALAAVALPSGWRLIGK
ncbi:biotin transporter BioY [Candidatus Viridilinea mediisalina]|uniref:Biotin transporter n=1 Tax=Candidatus Viridilinea mediisalina TaxID=2024553 RepID=A0A2A6RMG0_9CHLR|nr:biotin transporter BioY [Candidatus Viridilinea mediisalina]PDW04237.1 biotin transporter BioY [Candidatus Viridilinea mediisalina]